ncbi:MAG: acyl-CoA thioesterase [Gemmatimonadaceae bacterium]
MPPRHIELRVRYAETDQMRIVYHANYLVWCEIGRTEYIRSAFGSYADVERDGVSLAVVAASLRFHAPARYDNLIRVATTLREARSRTITLDYVISNAETGEKLVTASTTLASTDPGGRLVSMPSDLRNALEKSRE